MLKVRELLQQFKVILKIETERNQMIANSTFGDFAVSSDTVFEFAVDRFLSVTSDTLIHELDASFMGAFNG